MVMSKDAKKASCNLIIVYILQKGAFQQAMLLFVCLQILKQTFSSFIPDGFVLVIFHNHSAACANRLRRSFLERLSIVHSSYKQIWTLTIISFTSTAEARSSYGARICRSILQVNRMEQMPWVLSKKPKLFMWTMFAEWQDDSGKDSPSCCAFKPKQHNESRYHTQLVKPSSGL